MNAPESAPGALLRHRLNDVETKRVPKRLSTASCFKLLFPDPLQSVMGPRRASPEALDRAHDVAAALSWPAEVTGPRRTASLARKPRVRTQLAARASPRRARLFRTIRAARAIASTWSRSIRHLPE